MAQTFQCSVVTPEREALNVQATSVVFPAHDGEVGVLDHRAPLIFMLGVGVLRVEGPSGSHRLLIDGGFAQMKDNRLTLLTPNAMETKDLRAEDARQALADAHVLRITDDESFKARDRAIRRAQAQLKLLETSA